MIYIHEPIFIDGKARSRLTADSEVELLEYSYTIALRPEWIRNSGLPDFHFEVIGTKLLMTVTDPEIEYLTVRDFDLLIAGRVQNPQQQ